MAEIIKHTTKYVGKVTYERLLYDREIVFECDDCKKRKKGRFVAIIENGSKRICQDCYARILAEERIKMNRKKWEATDKRPKDVYNRIPLMEKSLSLANICPVCKNTLEVREIKIVLSNGIRRVIGIIPVHYCEKCNVGFASSGTSIEIRKRYPGYYADMQMVNLGKATDSVEKIWAYINGKRDKTNRVSNLPLMLPKDSEKEGYLSFNTTIYVRMTKHHKCKGIGIGTLNDFNALLYDKSGKTVSIPLKKCSKCGKIFINHSIYEKYKLGICDYMFIKDHTELPTKNETTELLHNLKPQNFLTRVNVFKCTANEHNIVDVKCEVKVLDHHGIIQDVKISAGYCETCKRYYILEPEYRKLKEKGIIICKVVTQEYWRLEEIDNEYNMNQESILHIMGYNVNAKNSLTKAQRWRILEIIVDEKILTRMEICSHLDYLIYRSSNRRELQNARTKWMMDREYIINYNTENTYRIEANSITKRIYKKVSNTVVD